MSAEVKVSGPLFEGRLDVKGGLKEGMDEVAKVATSLVRQQLAQRSRYRTAKYGHVVEAVRSQVKPLSNGDIGARIYLGGQSAFLAHFLEFGTRGHREPKQRILGTGTRRRLGSARRPLRFSMGGGIMFRQSVEHPGTPAYHWRQKAQAALEPQVQSLIDRHLGRALTR